MRLAPLPLRLKLLATAVVLAGATVPIGAVGAVGTASGCDVMGNVLGGCPAKPYQHAPAPAASCGGERPARAGGGRWTCTFDDEFAGTSLNRSAWMVQTTAQGGFHSGNECVVDTPQNVSVSHGYLNLTVRKLRAPMRCASRKTSFTTQWTGGSVYTRAFAQEFGRFEVRAKFPESHGARGLQSALWLFPTSGMATGPVNGPSEIDIAEAYSRYQDKVDPTVHGVVVLPVATRACTVRDFGAAFHTYAVVWTPSTITFSYDGAVCLQATAGAGVHLVSRPFLVALSQMLGIGRNTNNSGTPLPATEQIDYVRVWK